MLTQNTRQECYQLHSDNIIDWIGCLCAENPADELCESDYSQYSNVDSLPTVTYERDNLIIDTKIINVTSVSVRIFNMNTAVVEYAATLSNLSESRFKSIVQISDINLENGLYLVALNIDGFPSRAQIFVRN